MLRYTLSLVILSGLSLTGFLSHVDWSKALSQDGNSSDSQTQATNDAQSVSLNGPEDGMRGPGGMPGLMMAPDGLSDAAKAVFTKLQGVVDSIENAQAKFCGVDNSGRAAVKTEIDAILADTTLTEAQKHEKMHAVLESHKTEAEAVHTKMDACKTEKSDEFAKYMDLGKTLHDACLPVPPAKPEHPQGGMRHGGKGGGHGGKHGGPGGQHDGRGPHGAPLSDTDRQAMVKEFETKLTSTGCSDALTAAAANELIKTE